MAGTCVFVNIALNFYLIPHYGYLGAGIATVITEIVLFALGLYFVAKYVCKVNIITMLIRPLISVVIMGAFIVVIMSKLHLILVILLSALIYFSCLLLFRFLTKDDKVILLQLLGK
jgi:O-antigen/teichoic acid export membrane protein